MSPYEDADRETEREAEIAHAARSAVAGASDLVDAV
jgi:hypothetical protein